MMLNFQLVEENRNSDSSNTLASVQEEEPSLAGAGGGGTGGDDLPEGWEARKTEGGRIFYVDHNTHTTTWEHPRAARETVELGPLPVRERKRISNLVPGSPSCNEISIWENFCMGRACRCKATCVCSSGGHSSCTC